MATRRILIVDPNPRTEASLRAALAGRLGRKRGANNRAEYAITRVEDDEQALAVLERSGAEDAPPFDLVVTESRARGLDGTKILRALQNNHPTTAAIVVAACPRIPAAVEAVKLGASEFLAKPLEPSRLRDVLLQVMPEDPACNALAAEAVEFPAFPLVHALRKMPAQLARMATTALTLPF